MTKTEEFLSVVHKIRLLKRLPRTGWVNKNVENPESVAEHTWRVACISMFLAPKFKVDQLKLIKMALIHDLGEAAIGDLVWERGKKIVGSQKQKHCDEFNAVKYIFESNDHKEYVDLWKG